MKKYKMYILDACKMVNVHQDSKLKALQLMIDYKLISYLSDDVKCVDVMPEPYNAEKFNTIEVQQ